MNIIISFIKSANLEGGVCMKRITYMMAISTTPVIIVIGTRHLTVDYYIDAGTGSIIIQALIGGLAAVLVLLKIYWKKLKYFVHTKLSREKKDADITE